MAERLNIISGDSAAESFTRGGGQGDVLAWSEALSEGPARPADGASWVDTRAAFLAAAYGEPQRRAAMALAAQQQALDAARARQEINLWFGRDLFCQASLLYVASRLAGTGAQVWLVSPRDTGTAERACLGSFEPRALVAQKRARLRLTEDDLAFAATAWQAYSADTPEALMAVVSQSIPPGLACVQPALQLHLQRFPWRGDGLGRDERRLLCAVEAGALGIGDLLTVFGMREPGYGLADAQLFALARGLVDAGLLAAEIEDSAHPIRSVRYKVTDAGRHTLDAGAGDNLAAASERWIGGVAPPVVKQWRWDDARGALVRAAD